MLKPSKRELLKKDKTFTIYQFIIIFAVPRIESRTLLMQGNCSITELHSQPEILSFKGRISSLLEAQISNRNKTSKTNLSLNIYLSQQSHTFIYQGSQYKFSFNLFNRVFVNCDFKQRNNDSPLDNIHLFNIDQDFSFVSV